MLVPRRFRQAIVTVGSCVCASLSLAAPAPAAPITVNVRVEGSSATLFEGPVSTDAVPNPPGLETAHSVGPHACDVQHNGFNEGFGVSGPTPTAALHNAAVANGLAFDATWSTSLSDFEITQVGGDISNAEQNGKFWGYAVNYSTANVGGCQFQLSPGGEVLWAYNYFGLTHLLSLSGPASANAGTSFTAHVSDGRSGEPISGAAIGEVSSGVTTPIPFSPVTDASGNATVSLAHAGTVTLKATRADSVRSNGLSVCVHNGNDGSCGTTPPIQACPVAAGSNVGSCEVAHILLAPPLDVARISGLENGHLYARRFAPRVLRGTVQIPSGAGLLDVRIRLERRNGRRCFDFSGARARFVGTRRCGSAQFFSVGSAQSFSYLLPAPLRAGRYVYDIVAVDATRGVSKLVNGVSHVVFRVG
jgi:hypothetical protein